MDAYGGAASDATQPDKIDASIRFSSIGGLKEHIKCLREMIIFPLMYPEVFKKFNTRPAKGVLFHGPPGTGKTLLARALANECSLVAGKKVSFYMRKGADVINKYYGESEKNLRLLFQQARRTKPSIIFFDEIDALAPIRRQTENDLSSSVVATFLAEMDGLCDRGDVIVIGATNRPDAMDPAVRRAGRFDRELYFPPPEAEARRDILAIYTRDWDESLSNETLSQIAKLTVGYLGSDIKSLCSEAVLKAVKRVYPQIYDCDFKLLINAKNVEVTEEDMLAAMKDIVPSGTRYMPQAARPLPVHCLPLLAAQVDAAAQLLRRCYSPDKSLSDNESATAPSVFLISGECAETHIAPALLAQLEQCVIKELSVSTLHAGHMSSPEQAIISLFSECRRSGRPCVIFVRDLQAIWETLARKFSSTVLLQLWRLRSVGDCTLMLATCHGNYERLPIELQNVFPIYKDCIYNVRKPLSNEVTNFLLPVIKELPLVPPMICTRVPPPPLPRAPLVPRETEEDVIRRLHREYDNLRLLRVALSRVCKDLSSDHRFKAFTGPAVRRGLGHYPDSFSIDPREPLNLVTVLEKIETKKYLTAKEFLDDIDLICLSAFNMCRLRHDGRILINACSLHTTAYEKVVDAVDARVELECQVAAKRRREAGESDDYGIDVRSLSDIYFAKLSNHRFPDFSFSNHTRRCKRRRSHDNMREVSAKRSKYTRSKKENTPNTRGNKDKDVKDKSMEISSVTSPDNPETSNGGLPDTNKVVINTVELDNILNNNVAPLCDIGLEALIDLHAQLSKAVYACSDTHDRSRLPQDLNQIVARYVTLAKR